MDLGTPARKPWDSGSDSGRSDEEDNSAVFSASSPPGFEMVPENE